MCTNKVPTAGPNGQVIYRPCGRCLECLRQYQQDWTIRLDEEFKAWQPKSVIFFTLTYADAKLPLQVNFYNPFSLGFYQTFSRLGDISCLASHIENLGLKLFYYTRDLKHHSYEFRQERRALEDSYLDIPISEKPAIVVPTCCYDDVSTWLRYSRKYFSRHVDLVDYHGRKVTPYLKSLSWERGDFPDSAYSSSFKYFITSEYGPNTLRPHYHGVMMGVDEDMFKVFAHYWCNTFGDGLPLNKTRSVDFSVYDPTKGGAMYISKYCSKGSFDHPLVSRSVVYPSGKEYISRDYINCCKYFGVNEPFCVPPFRLMSKGIGIRYPFQSSVQDYWDVVCDSSTGFVVNDTKRLPFTQSDQLSLKSYMKSRLLVSEMIGGLVHEFVDQRTSFVMSSHELFKFDQRGKTIGHSFLDPVSDDCDDVLIFQNYVFNKKFVRAYQIVDPATGRKKTETYSCLMPRYYRRFLLSPYSQFALETAIHRQHESDYSRERAFVESKRSQDCYETFLEQISYGKSLVKKSSQAELAKRRSKFYNRTFIGDVK